MTRDEATRECERLASEHPDRATNRWLPRESGDGEWSVVRLPLPEGMRSDPLKTAEEARPKPPQADDPRSSHDRHVGGPWTGGGF